MLCPVKCYFRNESLLRRNGVITHLSQTLGAKHWGTDEICMTIDKPIYVKRNEPHCLNPTWAAAVRRRYLSCDHDPSIFPLLSHHWRTSNESHLYNHSPASVRHRKRGRSQRWLLFELSRTSSYTDTIYFTDEELVSVLQVRYKICVLII
jgi:hypothetical protein